MSSSCGGRSKKEFTLTKYQVYCKIEVTYWYNSPRTTLSEILMDIWALI